MRTTMGDERGLSLAGLLVSLLVLAVMAGGSVAALSLGGGGTTPAVTLPSASGSGAQPSAGGSGADGVMDEAADLAAQQNLGTALSVVEQAAASGGYAHITPLSLQGVAPQLRFTNGVSSDDLQASLAAASSPGGGSVTLAMRSDSGTCFFAWTAGATTWFGSEPDAPSCAATALGAPPAPSVASPGHVGWQQGAFPSVSG